MRRQRPATGGQQALKPYGKALTVLRGSILDPQFLQNLFSGRRVARVVHCAAITKDRYIMDTGRIADDLGYAPQFLRDAAYADFIDWIGRNQDFYTRPGM
jgi:nucleoside-diphosphate-sugar epimerase